MNEAQRQAVQAVLRARLPEWDRFRIKVLAEEVIEAAENKATPVKVASGVTVVHPEGS